ncbi:unnamed protein product [Acanthoscelides obtectus]|uniref:Transposase n=1 Tax=Acanthoscelides obtectus TaxID=200917 RepID=A0A9P0Q6I9_ACAOB|nr:unnamed protein product [Acanthoscelides obtectus]CAK1642448.1 hypothetical protein AOBTE_LOCUS13030 [Acanthoscelides obtectus]
MSMDDKPRSGRPSNVEKIRHLVLADRRLTIYQLSVSSELSWSSFVPRALTDNQKERRVETWRALKQQLKSDPNFLSKIVTDDETWCYGYDPETKQQSSQWKTPSSLRPKMSSSQIKHRNNADLFF